MPVWRKFSRSLSPMTFFRSCQIKTATMASDSDDDSVSSWGSSSSSGSSSSNSRSARSSATRSAASSSAAPPPGKYKRRRRVYERIKANLRYQPLATVPEGEELRDARSLIGPKLAGILVALIICIAGIKEGMNLMRELAQGGGVRHDTAASDELLRRRKRGTKSKIALVKSEEEDLDEEEDWNLLQKSEIPNELQYLAGIYDPILPTDRAFLWHVPRSAATTVKSIAAQCFGLLLATEMGSSAVSNQITIITDLEGGTYVNVDTSSLAGIQHAKQMNVANLPGLNFVAASFFYDAAENLFSDQHRGRCITMMRHPVERAVSLYSVLVDAPGGSTVVLPGMSLEDYANSDRVERNWMTRYLSNAKDKELKPEHLAIAKRVLEKKCLVGLLKFKGESLRRIETYFGWTLDGEKVIDCHTKLLDWNWPNKKKHSSVKEGSEAWRKLAEVNDLDMKLYIHVVI